MSSRLYYSLPCFGLFAAALSGCGENAAPVSIDYRQIGFCNTYTTAGGARSAKPNEVFVVYKIEAVDNAKGNRDFSFLPTRLYVDPGEWGEKRTPWKAKPGDAMDLWYRRDRRRYISSDTGFAQAMGVRALAASVMPHAAKTQVAGYSIVEVPTPGEGHPLEQTAFKLSYEPQEAGDDTPADPPVVLNNSNAQETAWPHPSNCQELTLEKTAS